VNRQSVIQPHLGRYAPLAPRSVSWSQLLFADQNQNAGYECQNSHHDCADADVKERSDSDKNQIDREQQHSNVFCDHASVLKQAGCLCTQKTAAAMRRTVDLHARQLVGCAFLLRLRGNQDRFAHAV
jgi:hypothetical protein